MAFTNPTTNSYRRLTPGFEAPTTAVFGLGNRTAAVRIPAYVKDPSKVRIEFRTIDATTNPYLDLLPWFWLVWTEYVVGLIPYLWVMAQLRTLQKVGRTASYVFK